MWLTVVALGGGAVTLSAAGSGLLLRDRTAFERARLVGTVILDKTARSPRAASPSAAR